MVTRFRRPLLLVAGASLALMVAKFKTGIAHSLRARMTVAACKGDMRTVKWLVSLRVNPNRPTPGWTTPLWCAASSGRLAVTQYLLASGADPNLKSGLSTPLDAAIFYDHIDVVRFLVENGADCAIPGEHGLPLVNALIHCRPEIVELLLRAGADPDQKMGASTPREIASKEGCAAARHMIAHHHRP